MRIASGLDNVLARATFIARLGSNRLVHVWSGVKILFCDPPRVPPMPSW